MKSLTCHLIPLFALAGLLVACRAEEPVVAPETPPAEANPDLFYIPGRVSVQFDDATTRMVEEALAQGQPTKVSALDGLFEDLGIKSLRRVFPDAGEWEPRTRKAGLHRFYYVEFAEDVPVTKAAGSLAEVPGIVSVTPQLPVRSRAFNDPYFSSQWHYVNSRYKDADINVQPVWDQFTVGSNKVIVSVVDEGVNMNHEDLQGNVIPGYADGTGSYNFNNDTPTVVPTQGHGTHVAGIIAATSNNGIGVAGVAGGDAEKGIAGARILSCQIFDLYGAQPDIYQAIKHGADHGAVILQCSWGFSPDMDGDGFTTDDEIALYRSYTIDDLPEYKAVLDYFIKYAGCDNDGNQLPDSPMKGGVAIFASGNDNFDYDPLVSYEPIIAVGAFGATGNKASYSNYGDWVDIAAPGGDGKQGIYSTLVGNSSYGGSDWQGTSMACPHVSGVAALLVSYFGGPGFTAEECRARILRGARANFFDSSRYIGKKLDAYGAFTVDLSKPVLPPVLAWSGEQPAMLGKEESASFVFTCEDPAGQRLFYALTPEIPGIALGENAVLVDAAQLKPGKYTLTLTARNEDHLSAQISASFEVLSNQAPVTTESCPKTGFIVPCGTSQTVDVSSWFQDPDGDALRFSAQVQQQDLAKASCSEEGQLTMEGLRPGITEVLVRASDGETATDVVLPLAVPQAGKSLFLFPEVATNQVYVAYHVATPVKATVTLASASGARLWQTETELDAFHPVLINLKDCAPGVYTVRIQGNGIAEVLSFAKI